MDICEFYEYLHHKSWLYLVLVADRDKAKLEDLKRDLNTAMSSFQVKSTLTVRVDAVAASLWHGNKRFAAVLDPNARWQRSGEIAELQQ